MCLRFSSSLQLVPFDLRATNSWMRLVCMWVCECVVSFSCHNSRSSLFISIDAGKCDNTFFPFYSNSITTFFSFFLSLSFFLLPFFDGTINGWDALKRTHNIGKWNTTHTTLFLVWLLSCVELTPGMVIKWKYLHSNGNYTLKKEFE